MLVGVGHGATARKQRGVRKQNHPESQQSARLVLRRMLLSVCPPEREFWEGRAQVVQLSVGFRYHQQHPGGSPVHMCELRKEACIECVTLISEKCHTVPHGPECRVIIRSSGNTVISADVPALRHTHFLLSLNFLGSETCTEPPFVDLSNISEPHLFTQQHRS